MGCDGSLSLPKELSVSRPQTTQSFRKKPERHLDQSAIVPTSECLHVLLPGFRQSCRAFKHSLFHVTEKVEQYFLHSRKKWLSDFNSVFAFAEYCPCFQLPLFERSRPSGVRGPVLAPPCMRHLFLFRMAGERHAVPFLVFAPQRGAILGSPGRLPFLSHPRSPQNLLVATGFFLFPAFLTIGNRREILVDGANNGLRTAVHVDMFDGTALFSVASMLLPCLHLCRVQTQ
jgi:hypothetical protein